MTETHVRHEKKQLRKENFSIVLKEKYGIFDGREA